MNAIFERAASVNSRSGKYIVILTIKNDQPRRILIKDTICIFSWCVVRYFMVLLTMKNTFLLALPVHNSLKECVDVPLNLNYLFFRVVLVRQE